MSVKIIGTGKGLPKKHVSNSELPKELNSDDEWVKSHTGISARYLADDTENSITLGALAGKNAIENAGVKPEDINLIICTTITPEHSNCPANACCIQDELQVPNAACYDVSLACTGFILGLDLAASQLARHDWKYALVISSEKLSNICDWTDRSTCVLFGDGAGAVVLENKKDSSESGIGEVLLGSRGSGAMALYVDKEMKVLKMDGHAVYDFAVKSITDLIKELMEKNNLTEETVDWIVCHQANERILKAAAKRLHLSESKFYMCMSKYGNTSSASIPLALDDMVNEGKLKKDMTVILAGFGAGLSYGGTVIHW